MLPTRLILAAAACAALGAHAQAPAPAAPAGNATLGAKKVYQCQGCHGIEGWKSAFPEVYHVPKLGGQKAAYIASALRAYKSGERDFPTMRAMVDPLSDADIADIAAYYAQGGIDAPQQGAKR
jgi:cytochrome c553